MKYERIAEMKEFFITKKGQKAVRKNVIDPNSLALSFEKNNTRDITRATERLVYVLNNEKAVVYPFEKIAFTRTVAEIPEIFTEREVENFKKEYHIHEKGDVCNINVDYSILLSSGLKGKKEEIESYIKNSQDEEKIFYWKSQVEILDALFCLIERYIAEAKEVGNKVVEETLTKLLSSKPSTLLEAMQLLRILHFTMWCGRNYHNTLGRMDQYLYPYYENDIKEGRLTADSALELIEEFFLTFNRDSDLYPGMQQGDNGQSLVLGGVDKDGKDLYNDLSQLMMEASLELKLIDPKINLRVNKTTPIDRYVLGTKMTKQGLGFPQYSNDDVVIKGLEELGYSHEDASNYVVAACWEFIIPGVAMDVPNIEALPFAETIRRATIDKLNDSDSYEDFLAYCDEYIKAKAVEVAASVKPLYVFPAPFVSLMIPGAVENAKDISLGAKYNNYGMHGTGIATAVDSIANIKKFIFEEKTISKKELLEGIENNFETNPILGNTLRYDKEKLGNDTLLTNEIAEHLLGVFASSLKGIKNERGGIWRAGTGSAMYYIWHATDMGATPDGRKKGEVIPANYSPSLFMKSAGPVSIIKSFALPNLDKVINGGPLTIEIHDSVFRNDESLEKVGRLIKEYIDLGGHQLQINTVNRDTLLDAQEHPEKYRNLIVRVWGWSGYFVELDKCYQDHIIKRIELVV